jgi:hypothetical protein
MKTEEKQEMQKEVDLSKEKITMFRKIRAKVCHHCPLCNHARKNPDSTIGKILHHKYHANHCPMWKAEKEFYGEGKETKS